MPLIPPTLLGQYYSGSSAGWSAIYWEKSQQEMDRFVMEHDVRTVGEVKLLYLETRFADYVLIIFKLLLFRKHCVTMNI